MAIDFGGLATTDNYSSAYTPKINEAVKALAYMLDPTYASYTGTPFTGSKRLNAGAFEMFNGSSWAAYSVSIGGNAATVTNGVVTTGSYANPAWITSLAGSKVSGAIAGNAATVTVANEAADTTCSILFSTAASGSLEPKTNANLTFNSNTGALVLASLGVNISVPRAALHAANTSSSQYTLIQGNAGVGGTELTTTDTIPIVANSGFSGYNGLAIIPNSWGNASTIDRHQVLYLGGAQRNNGAVAASLVFANWGYFTGTGAAAGGLGNATAQGDAIKFKFEFIDAGAEFTQRLDLYSRSASGVSSKAMSVYSSGAFEFGYGAWFGTAALATGATTGHLYIPTSAGAPTGVPAAKTGQVAFQFDTTNGRLYVYDGAWLAQGAGSGMETFTAGGTWTSPVGVTSAWVYASAGGGGGGSGNADSGGGGGGSGARAIWTKVTCVGNTGYTVTIGAGGAAGATGNTTSLGALLSLSGGAGGGGGAAGGAGGAAGGAAGVDGDNSAGGSGGSGGDGGRGGLGGNAGVAGKANTGGGGGGGGIGGGVPAGAAGGSGYLTVRW